MDKRKKLWEYILLQLFEMACKIPVAILLLTSYFIASKWWPISERNNLMFFSARKFRQRLDSEGEVVTF